MSYNLSSRTSAYQPPFFLSLSPSHFSFFILTILSSRENSRGEKFFRPSFRREKKNLKGGLWDELWKLWSKESCEVIRRMRRVERRSGEGRDRILLQKNSLFPEFPRIRGISVWCSWWERRERKLSNEPLTSMDVECLTGKGRVVFGHIPFQIFRFHVSCNSATNGRTVKRYDTLSLQELCRRSRGKLYIGEYISNEISRKES